MYLGYVGSEPVGASLLFLHGATAGIYHLGTVPEARGQGIGTAMTVATLRAGRELGKPMAVLRAAWAGLGIYRRLGFREYNRFGRYVWPHDSEGE
jgi:ribosomal protein S18 acetylase RimI-like enzyme